MAQIKSSTRMELKRLKTRLVTARRGHKLMKDKCDELMRQFLETVRAAKDLRRSVEEGFKSYTDSFYSASVLTDKRILVESLMLPRSVGQLEVDYKNIMSVIVPEFHYETGEKGLGADSLNYGFAFTSGELDNALQGLGLLTVDIVKLAELEKSALLLCDEIERTRRRVNALEYIMIPELEEGIKMITMKLDENERGNLTRLMKVKDMMVKAQLEAKHSDDYEEDE